MSGVAGGRVFSREQDMEYFQSRDSGRVYGADNFGRNVLEVVDGERCVIPVCEIPASVVRLNCTDEAVRRFVKAGSDDAPPAAPAKSWRQRLMVWRVR